MELILVFVVALLVIGPDKLPGAVRTASLWLGRFRRSYNKVKSEIERELNTDEIKRQLHNEAVLEEIAHVKKIADETKVSVDALVSSTSFDPGASSATESQLVNDLERNSIAPEQPTTPAAPGMTSTAPVQPSAKEEPKANPAARKSPSYGTGVNPKLGQAEDSTEVDETIDAALSAKKDEQSR